MKKHIATFYIVFVSLIIPYSCSTNPTDLAKRYPEVYNTHNVEEIVSLYTDDAVFEVVGQFLLAGKNQIRDITKYDSVLNIHMSVLDVKVRGDTVSCNLSETNDWLLISEIGEAHYKAIFIFEDRLIKHLKAEAKPETEQAIGQTLSSLMVWAKENKADLLTEMMPEGRFIYNAENAERTLTLLQEWKNSQK